MERSEDQDQPTEASEALDRLLPVVIKVEKKHLGFRGFENTVTELLNFEASLEWKLKLAAFDDNVREVQ